MNGVAKEEELDAPKLKVILLLLSADDMVLFSYNVDGIMYSTFAKHFANVVD